MQRVDKGLAGIETDKRNLPGFADVLKRQQHSGSGRFIRREDTLHFIAKPIQKIFGSTFRGVARGAGVLISGNQFDLRELCFELTDETLFAFGGAR